MHGKRALWVALGVAGVAFAAVSLMQNGPAGLPWMPPCLFNRLTGLHCPGCGMTRATWAGLNGNFAQAFRLNPLGVILLPLAVLALAIEMIGWVRGRALPIRLHLGLKSGGVLVGTILLFWIMRNIPAWPFTLLAPP